MVSTWVYFGGGETHVPLLLGVIDRSRQLLREHRRRGRAAQGGVHLEEAREAVEAHKVGVALRALLERVRLAERGDVVGRAERDGDGDEAGLDDGLHDGVGLRHGDLLLLLLLLLRGGECLGPVRVGRLPGAVCMRLRHARGRWRQR